MSKLHQLDSFYIKTKFKYHKKLKEEFLNLIDQMPDIRYDTITKSDYNSNTPKTYEKFFYYYFEEVLNEIGRAIKSKDVEITILQKRQSSVAYTSSCKLFKCVLSRTARI